MRFLYFALIRRKDHVTFLVAAILSTFILFSGKTQEVIDLRLKVSNSLMFIRAPIVWIKNKQALESKNADLRARNLQLKLLLESVRHLETENRQLRTMLDFKRDSQFTLVPATIYSRGIASTLTSFTIDVGASSGVTANDPVLIADGIVGKTIHVGENTSIVQLISDPNFYLSVKVVPAGEVGILSWLGNNKCEIREVPKSAKIGIGDLVYTSAHSDIYPADLPVGEVTAIYDERGSFQKRLTVETYFNISVLQYVFVLVDGND